MNSNSKYHSHRIDKRIERHFRLAALCVVLILSATTSQAATFTVGSTADSGPGSLRDAISSATNGDIINFFLQNPSTITLTSGALTVTQSVTIVGPGPGSLAIGGNGTNAVFNFSGGSVGISGLTITNGQTGIYGNAGLVTISNVVITGNSNPGGAYGGGVYATGADLIILNSTVCSNSAGYGGGIFFTGPYYHTNTLSITNSSVIGNSGGIGGGIYLYDGLSHVQANLSGAIITGNRAAEIGGGIYNWSRDVNFSNCVISSNTASGSSTTRGGGGGGIFADQGSAMTLANVTMIGNVSTGPGGAVCGSGGTLSTYSHVTLIGNSASTGGAIAMASDGSSSGGSLSLFNSVVISNSASSGGAIWLDSDTFNVSAQISNSTFADNQATNFGGAIYNDIFGGNGSVGIVGSTFSNNVAGAGGAIYSFSESNLGYFGNASVGITNSTFSANSAGSGGAIYNLASFYGYAPTGAIASVQIFNSTFSSNVASNVAGGICNLGNGATGAVSIVNSTFYNNAAATAGGVYNSAGPFNGSKGGTVLGVTNSTFSGNIAGIAGAIYNLCYIPPPATNGTASAAVQMFNSTFAGNSGTNGGGILYNTNYGVGSAPVQIGSTILNAGAFGGTLSNNAGTIQSSGYNLSSDNAGGALTNSTDLINTDPQLGPLQNNGGSVLTHALIPSSPAVDKGKNFSVSASDERGPGYARTYDYPSVPKAVGGDGTDIGAFELQTPFDPFAIWQLQNFGCTNCPQAAPTADPDADGANNMAEFLAGTNPNSSTSALRVLNVKPQGSDLIVTWQTSGGRTNVLQSSASLAPGSFSDISSNIVIPGAGDTPATYLQTGAALNGANSFYRVRLAQ